MSSISSSNSFHNIFINGHWGLKEIKDYFGDTPTILTGVLKRRSCPVDVVQRLLKQGSDVNCKDESGYSPLQIALIISNDEAVIKLLLEKGARVDEVDSHDRTPLLLYLQRKDCSVGIIQVLLDFKADINHKDAKGNSPLTTAIRNARDDGVVRVLVERGAEVNDLINLHSSPLLVLLRERKNCLEIVKLLLDKGADISYLEKCGDSPLITALEYSSDEEVIQVLLEKGADVNFVNKHRESPLLTLLSQSYCSVGIVKLLLHYKADVNHNSLLTTALGYGRDETIIRMLLENGADVNELDPCGMSPLCFAFKGCSSDIVKLLLDAGSSPNACRWHTSALHCATNFSRSGLREDIFTLLLETDVDLNSVDKWGQSLLCFALQSGAKPNDIRLLLEAGASLDACTRHSCALACATDYGCPRIPLREDVIQLLIDKGARAGFDGFKILQGALSNITYETGTIRLLLDLPGMNAHVVTNESAESLSYHAAKNRSDELVAELLDLPDVYAHLVAVEDMDSLLHYAVKNHFCSLDAVKLLVNRKARLNKTNYDGETPLHCALKNKSNNLDVVKYLVQSGSLVNLKNMFGKTPLTLAVEENSCDGMILELLIAGASIGELKLCHNGSDELELLEFLAREYQMCECKSTLDDYRMLVKFFFLQNPDHDISSLQNASVVINEGLCITRYSIEKLSDYVNECLSELGIMDSMQVGNGHTFREFVAGNLDKENVDLDEILKNVLKGDSIFASFPLFHDVIFARVKKLMIEQKFPDFLNVGRVHLTSVILRKIATFVSDEDFLRFILAFYNTSIHAQSKKVSQDDTPLGKRSSEPSSKCHKHPKLYH